MQDVWSPQLIQKITSFSQRKDRQYPELKALSHWYDYELTPRRRSFGTTKKYNR